MCSLLVAKLVSSVVHPGWGQLFRLEEERKVEKESGDRIGNNAKQRNSCTSLDK